ncbi:MAG: hypothetical protein B5766_06920 [Candidatus Lumbricidophila eiseniae]|uniref:Alkaline phosphatase family protein n=1 Tax=Candidatus Lumbricidiphila eiseniae TaxID=1969409 RepID=A0A2A6FRP7_9MICO|nr:MAG: hypothetical protein B5766_06920 [Candidatus Lumbricidophila eiseniae]
MLPTTSDNVSRLAEVLPSSIASLRGESNSLGLPSAQAVVVVLVDGLGVANLRARAGHARFLASRLGSKDVLRTVFPSTTAAAITTLCTGQPPGEHGIVGFRTLDPRHDELRNQLRDWDTGLLPPAWQRSPTVFEQATDIPCFVVGASRYSDSGFTRVVLRGARYVSAASIAERCAAAEQIVRTQRNPLVYLYVSELDTLAHAHGWESEAWLRALEELDAAVADFAKRMPRGTALLVTADHGVVDVPSSQHVFLDEKPDMLRGIRHTGGEPRCVSLYLEPGADIAAVAQLWREQEDHRGWVLTRDEVVAAGLFGPVNDEVVPRMGDIFIAARARIAYYDRRAADRRGETMIAQHGSLTDEEVRVPLIRAGVFAR